MNRYVYPAAENIANYYGWGRFDDWILSPRTQPELTDLPFLELCLE